MKIIIDKQTIILLLFTLTLMTLLLTNIVTIKMNNEKQQIINTYEMATEDYGQKHCEIPFQQYVENEIQKAKQQNQYKEIEINVRNAYQTTNQYT